MYGGSSLAARTHSQDHCRGTCHGIAAGKHALTGSAAVLVSHDTTLAVGLETIGSVLNQRVGACAKRHDHHLAVKLVLTAGDFHGAAAAGFIRLDRKSVV